MAIYLTEQQLRTFSGQKTAAFNTLSNKGLSTATAHAESYTQKTNVFLSHSHADKDLVLPAVEFLKGQGVNVYVDWLDSEMPPVISGETAEKLKLKIRENEKFLLLVTEKSKNSKWVPWELGVADGNKAIENIAVLPIDRTSEKFTGNEYLAIYPQIEFFQEKWLVWLSKPSICQFLPDWLKRKN